MTMMGGIDACLGVLRDMLTTLGLVSVEVTWERGRERESEWQYTCVCTCTCSHLLHVTFKAGSRYFLMLELVLCVALNLWPEKKYQVLSLIFVTFIACDFQSRFTIFFDARACIVCCIEFVTRKKYQVLSLIFVTQHRSEYKHRIQVYSSVPLCVASSVNSWPGFRSGCGGSFCPLRPL